ncbi:hypothetical protein EV424DRAFT_1347051 [Suillus variegatus]|nr:hypothetical protein EV424DRAFT_1347051 [Suillus variegatus]
MIPLAFAQADSTEEAMPWCHTLNNKLVLDSFLPICTALEINVTSQLSSNTLLFVHLTLVDYDTIGTSFELTHQFLMPYFPNASMEYHKVTFDVGTTSKVKTYKDSMAALVDKLSSTTWSCIVFGYERKTYVATPVHDFLAIILGPWQALIDCTPESFLWLFSCGALVNNAKSFSNLHVSVAHHGVSAAIAFNTVRFQQSFSAHLLLAFCKLVLIQCHSIQQAFPNTLGQFYKLGRHSDFEQDFQSNKDSSTHCSHVVKKAKNAILKAQGDHPGVTLPSSLKKDVAQKLFKQEIDDFDKAERVRKELDDSIKHRMGHAREWFEKMMAEQEKEVKDAMEKWNKEGCISGHITNNLKKKLEEISEELCRTMGCRVVILVSHKKKTDKSLAVTLHESKLQSIKKKNSVSSDGIKKWSSTDPTNEAQNDLEIDDLDKAEAKPELILDEEGYAKLPSCKGVALRGQQDLIKNIFLTSYKVFTKSNRPVSWQQIVANASHYLEATCVPKTLVVRDPSHVSLAKKKLVIFINAKKGDKMTKVADKEEGKKRKTKDYVKVLSSDEAEVNLASSDSMKGRIVPAEGLSMDDNYLELVDATHDLAKSSEQMTYHSDWPSWAKWSWRYDYLPKDIHESRKMLEASLNKLRMANISNDISAIPVVLGLMGIIKLHMRDRYLQNEEDENTEGKQGEVSAGVQDIEIEQEKDTEVEEEEVEVKQTGKKRSRTQVPSQNSKRAKTEPKVSFKQVQEAS